MYELNVSDFRKNMASALNRASQGEEVLVRRGRQAFAIVPVESKDLGINPDLQARLNKARDEYRRGQVVTLKTHDDIDRYFESL